MNDPIRIEKELNHTLAQVRHFFRLCNAELESAKSAQGRTPPIDSFKHRMKFLKPVIRSRIMRIVFLQLGIFLIILMGWSVWKYPCMPAARVDPATLQPNAQGLFGTYWNSIQPDRDKNPLVLLQRIDRTVDFEWSEVPPDPHVPQENYSVQWEGAIRADRTGDYRISTVKDDGVRLWLDGHLVIDNWKMEGVHENSITLHWKKGWHTICLDYLQLIGRAYVRLQWKTPDGKDGIIPADHLIPLPVSLDGRLPVDRTMSLPRSLIGAVGTIFRSRNK